MSGKIVRLILALALGVALAVPAVTPAWAQTITLRGASQFDDNHSYNQTMLKFAEAVQKYYGKPVNFVLHRNRELGLEKDYFSYMSQGISVDYAVFAPSHAATFSKAATLMDMPFLFRDVDHWNKVLSSGEAFVPTAEDVLKKADVMLIGYAGGGVRNIVSNKPVRNMAELKGLNIRVMGAPIQTRMFQAITASPTVIAYDEVYNAIQTNVINAGENEAPGWFQMKWHEVAKYIRLTQHAITIRPLGFSGKSFRKLPKDLQEAILKAGKDGAAWGRQYERKEDDRILETLKNEKKVDVVQFTERAKLLELAAPVKAAFAKEIEAEKILVAVDAVK
ncbi:MAG: TRAP transporter substrate-binding protein [candidate division NC10 bacterium]|nr:TRAP transporter substrate-binding protein [candidate division NC10 bacterium]